MVILVTNDDGITAPGIRALVEAMKPLGKVIVVAPDSPQSGKGHAVTVEVPLRLNRVDVFNDIPAWQCSGTPADCVKLARSKILQAPPDICVSGINHGINHAINILYSGTMSAAMEAAIEGVLAIGFSYADHRFDADFSLAKEIAYTITKKLLNGNFPANTLLNVNIPQVEKKDFRGLKICRQGNIKWKEEFDERLDPQGKNYYWLTAKLEENENQATDTDVWALENNYASVVPVQFDLTNYNLIQQLGQIL